MKTLSAKDKRVIDAAVSKGARRLDARRPNWFEDIHTPSLYLGACADCVCGQLYGDYDKYAVKTVVGGWVSRLVRRGWGDVGRRYGFDVPFNLDCHRQDVVYRYMTTAWKREIFARRRVEARAA